MKEGEFSLYVLDANVFISAHRGYYAFEIVPSFWENLLNLADAEKICSIDRIQDEIIRPSNSNPDKLEKWTSDNFRDYFMVTYADDVVTAFGNIQQWANDHTLFTQRAKAEFASNADAWIIAYAMAKGHTLVTHEVYNAETKNRILIPVVCQAFGVNYVNTFEMLEELKVKI